VIRWEVSFGVVEVLWQATRSDGGKGFPCPHIIEGVYRLAVFGQERLM